MHLFEGDCSSNCSPGAESARKGIFASMTQIRSKRSVERDKVSFSVHVNKTCAEENSSSEKIVNFNDSPLFAHATFATTGQVLLP